MTTVTEALEYLEGARFANYSGQIVEQKHGKDHLIVCEIGCVCSEVEPRVADEYGEVLVTLLNSAALLIKYEKVVSDVLQSVQDEMQAGAVFANPMLSVASRIALAWQAVRLNDMEDE